MERKALFRVGAFSFEEESSFATKRLRVPNGRDSTQDSRAAHTDLADYPRCAMQPLVLAESVNLRLLATGSSSRLLGGSSRSSVLGTATDGFRAAYPCWPGLILPYIKWADSRQMRCQYCNKRVGIAKQLKGQPFCSDEHRDLYLHGSANEVIERLRSSFTEFAPKRLDAERPEVKPEPAKPVRPQAKSVTEPEASQVAPETSPAQAGVFASSTPAPDPRESDFIRFPMVEPRPSAGPLRIPLGDAIQTPLRHPQLPSWQADYRPASEVSSLIPHALACDSSWECHRGLGPAMPPLAGILRPRRDVARMVPSVRRENMRAWPRVPFFATSPGFPMPSKQLLVAQAAHLPAATTLSATLGNQTSPSTSNVFALGAASSPQAIKSGAPLRCEPSSSDVNSAWLQVEIAGQLPRTAVLPPAPIGLSRATDAAPLGCSSATSLPPAIETAAPTGSAPPLLLLFRPSSIASAAMVASPVAPESTTPLHCEPPSSDVNSAWLQIVIASQLPRVTTVLPPAPVGLNLAAHTVLLGCSSAANFPPALETAAPVTSPLPFLLLFRPSSIAAPAMPLWLNTRPLKREASRPPAAVSEQRRGLSAAYLPPSSPSPLSLATWPQSLSISVPAWNFSNLGGPAPIGVSANQGRTHAPRSSSPSWRGYWLTPSLPQPDAAVWSPVAPTQVSLLLPAIQPIRPGSQGTHPPCIAGVRLQPASMTVLPLASAPFEPGPGIASLGPSLEVTPEDTLKLTSIDAPQRTTRMAWELRGERSPVLPWFSARRHASPMGLAPCSHRVWRHAIPSVQILGVQPFSVLKPLAWSMAVLPPGAGPSGLEHHQGLTRSLLSAAEALGPKGEPARTPARSPANDGVEVFPH